MSLKEKYSSQPYSALLVAGYIATKLGLDIPAVKIQKLVYISHGYALAMLGQPLISDRIEAWKLGPVIPSLYHALKHDFQTKHSKSEFGSSKYDLQDSVKFFKLIIPTKILTIIDKVLDKYGHLTGRDLTDLTHKEKTPWSFSYKKDVFDIEIPNELIKKYYSELLNDGRQS